MLCRGPLVEPRSEGDSRSRRIRALEDRLQGLPISRAGLCGPVGVFGVEIVLERVSQPFLELLGDRLQAVGCPQGRCGPCLAGPGGRVRKQLDLFEFSTGHGSRRGTVLLDV